MIEFLFVLFACIYTWSVRASQHSDAVLEIDHGLVHLGGVLDILIENLNGLERPVMLSDSNDIPWIIDTSEWM